MIQRLLFRNIFLSLSICFGAFGSAHGQTLSSDRQVDWSLAGSVEAPDNWIELSIIDFGGFNDGTQSNNNAFDNAIASMNGAPTILFLPAGEYLFDRPIILPDNFILRGESAQETTLNFNLIQSDYAIKVIGEDTPLESAVMNTLQVTEDKLEAGNSVFFQPGDFLYVYDSDTEKVESNWANFTTGQINQVSNISNSVLRFKSPFRRTYRLEDEPKVRKIRARQMVGIEHLKIVRLGEPLEKNSNIFFHYAANCWVHCIESYYCDFAHLEIARSSNIEVTGSYFHQAFDYGGGGKAYGVVLHYGSGECLIENNIFEYLRHSILLQAGANGNVVAYNYSTNPFWEQPGLPEDSAGDLVLHGNYPYANLLEGNIVQNIVIDDSHGIQGPFNTFFRNRSERYGLFMSSTPASDQQNLIGNEVTGFPGIFLTPGNDHFIYGNNIGGMIEPPGTEILPDSSYYLNSVPSYFQVPNAWPAIGPSNEIGSVINEAYARYEVGAFVACADVDIAPPVHPPISTKIESIYKEPAIQLSPNPARDQLFIQMESFENIIDWKIINASAQLISVGQGWEGFIDLNQINQGMYWLQIRFKNGVVLTERFVIIK